jgi:hypothetical protein
MKKIEITENQRQQFNLMRMALIQIHKDYQTPSQLRRDCKGDYGLEFEETIEMAYENIQHLAKSMVKGVKAIEFKP